MIIKNGNIITEGKILYNTDIKINNGLITEIGEIDACEKVIDASGMYVCSGFIDIHTHGGYGGDFMDAEEDSFDKALKFHSDNGTTSVLATSVTSSIEQIENMLRMVRVYNKKSDFACRVLGAHVEGPYISHKNKGAQNEKFLRVPQRDSYDFLLQNSDVIKTVTIAPELEGAIEMTKDLIKNGIVVSGGHDDGEKDKIMPVIDAGMSHCTHLWCAMSTVAMRNGVRNVGLCELGLIDDRLSIEIIADNFHITPEMVKLIYKCKDKKICLVSDSLRAGGMEPDENILYALGDKNDDFSQKFVASYGVGRLPDGSRYAGSIQPLNQMLKNVVFDAGISLVDAINSITINPARVIGVDKSLGSIELGKLADICIMDSELNIKIVIVNGKIVKK